jgi:hypothetical protein
MKGKIFTAQEVQAIISGNKRMFREVIKSKPLIKRGDDYLFDDNGKLVSQKDCCPYQVGQKIFVKEIWGIGSRPDPWGGYQGIEYKADKAMIDKGDSLPCYEIDIDKIPAGVCLDDFSSSWQNARMMPQWASRIILQIKEIKVEKENNLWVWVINFEVI